MRKFLWTLALVQLVPSVVVISPVRGGDVAAVAAGGTGGGNPFRAHASTVLSIYNYGQIDDVTGSVNEFIELNSELPGSVKPATVTPEVAVRNLRAIFAGAKNQAFLKTVAGSPALKTAEALNATALAMFARSRSAEGLALLLEAVEKAPREANAWMNLASAALVFRQANEALALITRAEALGALPNGAWGMSGARLADYLRGYAFMLRGEYEKAHPLLVRVVEAEPSLKEAALTLALVEAKLGKNPRRSYLLGVWRQPVKLIVRDPPESGEGKTATEPDALVEGEQLAPSMPDLLDVSKGKPGQLPRIKRPATPIDLMGMLKPYGEAMMEAMTAYAGLHNDVAGKAYQSFVDSDAASLYKRRMVSFYDKATIRYGVAAELDRAARDTDTLAEELRKATEQAIDDTMAAQEPIKRRHAEFNNRPGHPTKDELRQQSAELNASTQAALDRTSSLLARYHTALDREYAIRSSYMHGMLAHIGAPALRTALIAEAEAVRHETAHAAYASVLMLAPTIGAFEDATPAASGGGERGSGPDCTDDNAKWSVTIDIEIVEVELSCNSASCEIATPIGTPFLQGSLELGIDTSGTMSVFAGPKVSLPGVGSVKEGLYLTAGKEGMRDFGGKVEVKASSGVGPISVSRKVSESAMSFVPGPDPGAASGPLPRFNAD